MDPVEKLPPEITSEIFASLDASTLLTASLASKTWRERILDSRLWKQLYTDQGWVTDVEEVKTFEDAHTTHATVMRDEFRKARTHLRSTDASADQPLHKRRATSNWLGQRARNDSGDIAQWREQHGVIEADGESFDSGPNGVDQDMPDVSSNDSLNQLSPQRRNKRLSLDSGDEMALSPIRRRRQVSIAPGLPIELSPPLKPSLATRGQLGQREIY